jgi:hypothetical protein
VASTSSAASMAQGASHLCLVHQHCLD